MSTEQQVTGIIIFFNAERFLTEAIESVLHQSYDNWELILVDDGSTDGSTDIAKYYATRYPKRIRVVEHDGHENRGMSASRNRGIGEARGQLVAFLDADDKWEPHKLSEQVAVMTEYPRAAMSFGSTLIWHSWTDEHDSQVDLETEDWCLSPGPHADELVEPPGLLVQILGDEWTCPCTCSVMIRRFVFDELSGYEEDFRGQMEDMVFYTKVLLSRPAYVSSHCWGLYRQHSGNSGKAAMATGEWIPHQPNRARHRYLRWVERYLGSQIAVEPSVHAVLQRELLPYQTCDWMAKI